MSPQHKQTAFNVAPWVALMLAILGFAGKLYSDNAVQQSNVNSIMIKLDKIEQKLDNQAERIARLEK